MEATMNTTPAPLRTLVLAALVGPMTFGCATDEGPSGLDLSDAAYRGCSGSQGGLDRPYAVGARIDLQAQRGGQPVAVTAITPDDPTVLTVEALANPATLRALAPGTTGVTVRSGDGATAEASIEVAAVAEVLITPWTLTPFNLDATLEEPHPGAASVAAPDGYGLLPDGTLRLAATLRDAAGRDLAGYEVVTWSATPAEAVEIAFAEARSDDALVTVAAGAAPGPVAVATSAGGVFTVTLVPTGSGASLGAYSPEQGQVVTQITLAVGEARTVVGVLYDADGRFLLGDDGQPFAAHTDAGGAAIVAPPWAEPEGDVAYDDAARAILEDARVVYLRGVSAGAATLTLEAAGVTATVPITVTP
jgi:hypothetical protein